MFAVREADCCAYISCLLQDEITFLLRKRVSQDCLEGGRPKAIAAADRLRRIFPGIVCPRSTNYLNVQKIWEILLAN